MNNTDRNGYYTIHSPVKVDNADESLDDIIDRAILNGDISFEVEMPSITRRWYWWDDVASWLTRHFGE